MQEFILFLLTFMAGTALIIASFLLATLFASTRYNGKLLKGAAVLLCLFTLKGFGGAYLKTSLPIDNITMLWATCLAASIVMVVTLMTPPATN